MKRGMFNITLSINLGMFFIHAFNSNKRHYNNLHNFLYSDEKKDILFFIN